MQRIVAEIATMRGCIPLTDQLIIGHGSGSFGHVEARKYNTIQGVSTAEDWLGFTKVAHAASELSQLIFAEFAVAELPVMRFQPSASVIANNGTIQFMNTDTMTQALEHNIIPLIHGDVAFDNQLGGTIVSTETIFTYLVQKLNVGKIILLGEVDGVLDNDDQVIPQITPESVSDITSALGGSSGVDVTGGMYQKVMDMLHLIQLKPDLEIIIANGRIPNLLTEIMCNRMPIGTKIFSG
jgi:isopentenyl phosphate kinase